MLYMQYMISFLLSISATKKKRHQLASRTSRDQLTATDIPSFSGHVTFFWNLEGSPYQTCAGPRRMHVVHLSIL